MLLTYDDNAKTFIFDIEQPMDDVMDFSDLIEVHINIPGGISSFARAYAIAKYFERGSANVVNHVHAGATQFQREGLDKKLRLAIDTAERMIAQAASDFEVGDMPEDMLEVIQAGSQSTINACQHFLEASDEVIQGHLFLDQLHITETSGTAHFSLPGVGETMVEVQFTMTMPKIETEMERALVEREGVSQLH